MPINTTIHLGLSEVIHLFIILILSHLSPTHPKASSSCGCDTHIVDDIVLYVDVPGSVIKILTLLYKKQSTNLCKIVQKFCLASPSL